jgi:predicted acyl esterase
MTTIRTDFPHKVRVIENLWVPMPDGTRLAARVWMPEDAGPVPAILEYIPYRKRDGTRTRDAGLHAYLAGHGYACIRLDIRGTGDSEGVLHDEYTPQEQEDGVAAIAWLAAQDWCDGQVAMIGISWGGFNGLQIAARQPPALKTIITVGSTDDRYATDVHYIGGCLSKDNLDWSATMVAAQDLPPDPVIYGPGWREAWAALGPHLAETPTPRRLLETGLCLRRPRADHDPRLCRLGLGRQLFRIRPPSRRHPARPGARADRTLGAFLSA